MLLISTKQLNSCYQLNINKHSFPHQHLFYSCIVNALRQKGSLSCYREALCPEDFPVSENLQLNRTLVPENITISTITFFSPVCVEHLSC